MVAMLQHCERPHKLKCTVSRCHWTVQHSDSTSEEGAVHYLDTSADLNTNLKNVVLEKPQFTNISVKEVQTREEMVLSNEDLGVADESINPDTWFLRNQVNNYQRLCTYPVPFSWDAICRKIKEHGNARIQAKPGPCERLSLTQGRTEPTSVLAGSVWFWQWLEQAICLRAVRGPADCVWLLLLPGFS